MASGRISSAEYLEGQRAEKWAEAKQSGRQAPTGLSYTPCTPRVINEQAWKQGGSQSSNLHLADPVKHQSREQTITGARRSMLRLPTASKLASEPLTFEKNKESAISMVLQSSTG